MAATEWTAWRPLRLAEDVPVSLLGEQLDGGQSFRWRLTPDGDWVGIFGRTVAMLRSRTEGLEWRGLKGAAGTESALRVYLDAEGAQARLSAALPWRSDPVPVSYTHLTLPTKRIV